MLITRILNKLNFHELLVIKQSCNKCANVLSSEYISFRGQHFVALKTKNARTFPTAYNVIPQPKNTGSVVERQEYNEVFADLINDLEELWAENPQVKDHYVRMLKSNVPNHHQAPGFAVVAAYKAFAAQKDLTEDNIRLANILGWCVDMFICQFELTDDIMDASETRHGLQCWYKNPNVGLKAINDSLMTECAMYSILRKHFSKTPCYVSLLEWFREVSSKTTLGQALDNSSVVNGQPQLESFTMNKYSSLAKYKATYGEFLLPTNLALYLAGKFDTKLHRQAMKILMELGEFFTAQNDVLDCYGDSAITGKVGTDIRQGKFTWLVVVALQRATTVQKEFLRLHYGRAKAESELEVRALYDDLGVLDAFLRYEEESFNLICKLIRQMAGGLPQEFFFRLVETTYGQGRFNYVPRGC